MAAGETLLQVKDLSISFSTDNGIIDIVDNVCFDIEKGEIVGMVGESGSGKSLTAKAVMKLLKTPPAIVKAKNINLAGEDIFSKSEAEMRKIRGSKISMIFQEPDTSLNPVITIGSQLQEVIHLHSKLNKKESWAEAAKMLELVEIPLPKQRLSEYPHRLSGGMRQRVMIAMALSCNPYLLIADEPTTALDVTIQNQILKLIKNLQLKLGMSVLLITHDLGIISEMAKQVLVMYAGRIMEKGAADKILSEPMHPYTRGLIESIPRGIHGRNKLKVIPGNVPNPTAFPEGCRFHPRCSVKTEKCLVKAPPAFNIDGHEVSCWLYE